MKIPKMERDNKGRFLKGGNLGHKQLGGFDTVFKKGHKGNVGKRWKVKNPRKMGGKRLSGDKCYQWKGGKPDCVDCGKKLSSYGYVRCSGCAHKKELNNAWKGGISVDPYPREFNAKLKMEVRERDNFTCCLCGKTEREELEELNRVLSVNHIDFNKNNCKKNNLNSLCLRCNIKINREREYWTNYFNQKI